MVDFIPIGEGLVPPNGLSKTINNEMSISSEGHYYGKTDEQHPKRPSIGETIAHELGHMAGLRHIDDPANPQSIVDGMLKNQSATAKKVPGVPGGPDKIVTTTTSNLMDEGTIVNPEQRGIIVNTVEQQQKQKRD